MGRNLYSRGITRMETFFRTNELKILEKDLKIDVEKMLVDLSTIEHIFLTEYEGEINVEIEEQKIDRYYSKLKKTKKPNDAQFSRLMNSFAYYYGLQRNEYKNLLKEEKGLYRASNNNPGISKFDLYKNALLNFECSLLNLLLCLVENVDELDKRSKKLVGIFESCQAEKHPLGLMNEVKKVREILLDSKLYYPIVRFSVNERIFNDTLKRYTPELLHFVCHGEINGDIALVNGNATGMKYMSPGVFVNTIKKHYGKTLIDFIYINSCYSDRFVDKISSSIRTKINIDYALSYKGINNNNYATIFSELFYDQLSLTNTDIFTNYCKVKSLMSSTDMLNYINGLHFKSY
ncbi:MAG: hypothetical protein HUJ68_05055 [Clostridia bacterium]|nr:hypothetical protein [Clostridia bacterium]